MDNSLLSEQREKSGSQTFKKYSYQYHWALERAILEHKKESEYAIFIELHEDVIYANSLNSEIVQFEFNQIKTDKDTFSLSKLTSLKNNRSVLGKLLESTLNKDYSPKILEINLVSVNGFNLAQKRKNLKFEKLNISDIADQQINEIADKIRQELSVSKLPANLNFIVPNLKEANHQDAVIGEISTLINSLFPKANFNPVDIYQLLIDDLYRKGQNQFDYKKWEDAIANKALTSQKVTETINEFTSHKDESKIEVEFIKITDELGYNSLKRKEIRKAFDRYKTQSFGSRTSFQMKLSKKIKALIESEIANKHETFSLVMDNVILKMKPEIKNSFISEIDLRGAIIYEFIRL